jgi:hypothetical protein
VKGAATWSLIERIFRNDFANLKISRTRNEL